MYMNSTFHSSGTASGNVEMMNAWKPIISTTAATVSVWSCENSRISGVDELDERAAHVGQADGALGRTQVLGEVAVVQALDRLRRAATACCDTIGGITFAKCRPNFENAAPHQTITISSFAATIMSTNGKKAKNTSAGRYCSPRAAMKSTLSRRPRTISSTMTAMTDAGGTRPLFAPIAWLTDVSGQPGARARRSGSRSAPRRARRRAWCVRRPW